MKKTIRFFVPVILCASFLTIGGCGDGGNTVIQPTEQYQPTETERANAEREAKEREAEQR